MLSITWLAIALGPTSDLLGEEPPPELSLGTAFEPLSDSDAALSSVLILATDDDPYRTLHSNAMKRDDEESVASQELWCHELVTQAYRSALKQRPGIAKSIRFQGLPVGLPQEVTGGEPHGQPSRAITFLCDRDYRLLAFSVGVPDEETLLTMIEDADETRLLQKHWADDPSGFRHALVERAKERVSRVYREALAQANGAWLEEPAEPVAASEQLSWVTSPDQLRQATEPFDSVYFADARLRFGLTGAGDARRLLILEQHPQTRRDWCDSLLPLVAEMDVPALCPTLIAGVWGFPPVCFSPDQSDTVELAERISAELEHSTVVLSVNSGQSSPDLQTPVSTAGQTNLQEAWQRLHDLVQQQRFYSVDLSQLSQLTHHLDLKPINVLGPPVRYVIIPAKNRDPVIVRETELPGRFIALLRRSQ
ncbi:hypothetical protein FYK55_04805 [Roseiconus nitratireducens]|uniref:Uncharacterized protein n=1 Tax=Roseiconus nitratireducens TaxID=2605748 RepID=A0A5M6DFN5_9BACT|nr:hypothetical protein [Roseiconus nitratireducens]KAA5546213.1 hypothetical protein FYK55_04805 [Roseiconus nitratireducens]